MFIHQALVQLKRTAQRLLQQADQCFKAWTKPSTNNLVSGVAVDLLRSRSALMAENAFLRQQLIVCQRQIKQPHLTQHDRRLLVLLASRIRGWKNALILVTPATLLSWHRQGFRLFWRWKSRPAVREPRIAAETVALIKRMAIDNRLWGAKRIRGELLKLGIPVSKRTIQKYMRQARRSQPPLRASQAWSTFLKNHASQIWACDFLQTYDLWFRVIFVFVIIELSSRRIVHMSVTRAPSDVWAAQQLREATPFGQAPRFMILDNDAKYGVHFQQVATSSQIKLLHTPPQAPQANAVCERCLGSIRRECLDHLFILSEGHLQRIVKSYKDYFNHARPHQGIAQRIPEQPDSDVKSESFESPIIAVPVLGGLHHDYCRAA